MQDLSRPKLWILTIGISFSLGFSACSSNSPNGRAYESDLQSRVSDTSKITEGGGVKLSEAIKKNLKTDPITPERKALLQFISKSMNVKKGSKADENFAACDQKFNHAPECAFIKKGWADAMFDAEDEDDASETETALKVSQRNPNIKMTRSFKRKHSRVVTALVNSIRAGKVEPVKDQIEGDYYRAFKKFTKWSDNLEKFAHNVIDRKECLEPELYTYLAMKTEEFFPDEARAKDAVAIYSKADQCAITQGGTQASNKYVQLSRFRLGLLSVLNRNCTQAEDVFGRLSKVGPSDYSTRALYWTAYCVRSEYKKDEFLSTFDELFRTNPLGYHTLSINNGDSTLASNLSKPIDPLVRSRTVKDGQMNVWIGLLEDFDRMGENRVVYSLLSPARNTPEQLLKLEPGVRLYLATFSYRAKDMISLFRMLDSVFRTQSEYVVDSTLKLFYPLKYFDLIIANSKKVNPILIAALVRQESAFQEAVKSRVGAVGLMQLMPSTARRLDHKVRRAGLIKPDVNLRLGVKYFEMLVSRYDGDVELALAAYNAGANVVDQWQKRYPVKNRLLFLDLIPFAETRNYVTLIGRNYYWYTKIYAEQAKSAQAVNDGAAVEFRGMKSE